MSNFTAADVKRLRDSTGAGMMDCKKALTEADGDFDRAVEVLRVKGAAKAAKRDAERSAANGVVVAFTREDRGALLALNCETDFVAKNERFVELAQQLVEHVADQAVSSAEELATATLADGRTADGAVEALAAVIGEKLTIGKVAVFDGPTAVYLHRRDPQLPPQVGVLVSYQGEGDGAAEAVKGTAMQVAAMRPTYLSADRVPADVLDQERRIAEETARAEGKPEAALSKIVEGRMKGFLKDAVLLEQQSVHDQSKSVGDVLAAAGATVTDYVRFEAGQA